MRRVRLHPLNKRRYQQILTISLMPRRLRHQTLPQINNTILSFCGSTKPSSRTSIHVHVLVRSYDLAVDHLHPRPLILLVNSRFRCWLDCLLVAAVRLRLELEFAGVVLCRFEEGRGGSLHRKHGEIVGDYCGYGSASTEVELTVVFVEHGYVNCSLTTPFFKLDRVVVKLVRPKDIGLRQVEFQLLALLIHVIAFHPSRRLINILNFSNSSIV